MAEMTGGCLCGQVRYTANADPVFVGVCHCTHCQKQTGTAFSVLVGIPKSAMSIQGELKTFHDTGDSGQPVERNFCPECGSPIFSDVAVMPGLTFIKAGTLDDTSWLDPKMHVYCSGDGKRRSAANKKSLNHGHLLPRVEHARTTPCNPSTQQRRNIFPALGEVT
jgi:hypothetical protein